MTILELQKRLKELYNECGNIEVMIEDTDWQGIERYHFDISLVDNTTVNGENVVIISSN